MKSVLPDTSVIIDFLDGDRTFEKELSTAERIIVTPSVIAEFMAGISSAKRDKAKQSAFDVLVENPSVEVSSTTMKRRTTTPRYTAT